jgi:hypothetical protein
MDNMTNYVESLSKKEKVAYIIAKSLLGSSFSLEKSNGYIIWLKKNQPTVSVDLIKNT